MERLRAGWGHLAAAVMLVLTVAGSAVPAWAAGGRACIDPSVVSALKGPPPWPARIIATARGAANHGCATAQSALGAAYYLGHGVPQDYAAAAYWYRLAAKQGVASAQSNLGVLYDRGHGVPQDYAKAAYWFRLAAGQGYAFAQSNLGVLYARGEGVPQDYAKAVHWFRLAAGQGFVLAQYNLGLLYDRGVGVPRNYVEAYKWFNLAAARGDSAAGTARDRVSAAMTRAQIAEAQLLSERWRPQRTPAPASASTR